MQNGKKVNVDFVIVAVGVEPDTALAKKSNLETDPEIGGFLVNAELQARSDLYIVINFIIFVHYIYNFFIGWRLFVFLRSFIRPKAY